MRLHPDRGRPVTLRELAQAEAEHREAEAAGWDRTAALRVFEEAFRDGKGPTESEQLCAVLKKAEQLSGAPYPACEEWLITWQSRKARCPF